MPQIRGTTEHELSPQVILRVIFARQSSSISVSSRGLAFASTQADKPFALDGIGQIFKEKIMRSKNLIILLALAALLLTGCSSMKNSGTQTTNPATAYDSNGVPLEMQKPAISLEEVAAIAPNWPESSQAAVRSMLEKYGQPTEQTTAALIWTNVAPYKRIVIYREAVTHKFPILHDDVIEHVVNYRIPVERAFELIKFDGSISFNRTAGELAVRSDKEAMNILALNLASDILSGRRNAENARVEYGKRTVDLLNGNRTAQTENLQFIAQNATGDADQSAKINWVQAEEARPATAVPNRLAPAKAPLKQAQEEEMAE